MSSTPLAAPLSPHGVVLVGRQPPVRLRHRKKKERYLTLWKGGGSGRGSVCEREWEWACLTG